MLKKVVGTTGIFLNSLIGNWTWTVNLFWYADQHWPIRMCLKQQCAVHVDIIDEVAEDCIKHWTIEPDFNIYNKYQTASG